MIVSVNPNIDIPHPIHVMIERVFDCSIFRDTSNIKVKFVKWSHMVLSYKAFVRLCF